MLALQGKTNERKKQMRIRLLVSSEEKNRNLSTDNAYRNVICDKEQEINVLIR